MNNILKSFLVITSIIFLSGFANKFDFSFDNQNYDKVYFNDYVSLLSSSDTTCDLDYPEGTCAYYLGHADEDNEDCPVYWLNYVYQIVKYGIIVAVIVFDMLELTSAITKDGLESKVLKKCVLRLVIAIAIILLPTVIDAFGQIIGVDGILCGIK